MKKIFLIAILYWFSSNIFSQNLNYEYYINNNKLLHCNKMITTQDGGYIIVGANSANSSSAQTDYLDGFIMKLSSTGLVLWTTNITNNLSDVNRHEAIYDIIQLTDGSYVACGNAIVDNSILNDDNNSGRRGFLIHVSNTGSIINSKLFTATDHPFGISSNVYPSSKFSKIIQIPNTNDFIISGTFERFTTIMRINATSNDFNVVWSKIINYWYLNINPAIITDGSNGFIISTGFGSFYSFDYNGTLLARNKFDYSNVDFYDNLDMAWYKDKLAVTARTTGGMILFSLDRSLNLSNAIPPVLINATNGHNVGSNHRLLSNGNLLKIIGTEGYYDATLSKNVIRPILINYNNGNILAKGVKNGYFGDHAYTFGVGQIKPEVQKLLDVTKECLYLGIEQFKSGNRIGDIGFAIQQHAEKHGYGVVRELVGHGLGKKLHEDPEVPNYGKRGDGPKIKDGMVIAIEPMINMGTKNIKQHKDGWTITTADGKPSAHFEHDVALVNGKPELLSTFKYVYDALGIVSNEEDEFRTKPLVG